MIKPEKNYCQKIFLGVRRNKEKSKKDYLWVSLCFSDLEAEKGKIIAVLCVNLEGGVVECSKVQLF